MQPKFAKEEMYLCHLLVVKKKNNKKKKNKKKKNKKRNIQQPRNKSLTMIECFRIFRI